MYNTAKWYREQERRLREEEARAKKENRPVNPEYKKHIIDLDAAFAKLGNCFIELTKDPGKFF